MGRTRFMSWFILALSLAFFCLPDFRAALEAPVVSLLPQYWTGQYGGMERADRLYKDLGLEMPLPTRMFIALGGGRLFDRFYTLQRYVSPESLLRLASEADRKSDCEFLAFAALHLPAKTMRGDVIRLTERAAACRREQTWLYFHVAYRLSEDWPTPSTRERVGNWIDRLHAWDPNNGASDFLRAEMIRAARGTNWPRGSFTADDLDALELETQWRQAMTEAYARSKFDLYDSTRFEMERRVMLGRKWRHPVVVVSVLLGHDIPEILPLRQFADLLVLRLGAEAEARGHIEEAFGYYYGALRFGDLLRLGSRSLIEELVGIAIQRNSTARLSSALKKSGRAREAAEFDTWQNQMRQDLARRYRNPFGPTSHQAWSALTVNITAFLVWTFLFLTLLAALYVNAKLWIRREKRGRLYKAVATAENYFRVVLLLACLVLYLAYAPFAQNFEYYINLKESPIDPSLMFANSFPKAMDILGEPWQLPVGVPYRGYAPYALSGLVVLVVLIVLARSLAPREERLSPEETAIKKLEPTAIENNLSGVPSVPGAKPTARPTTPAVTRTFQVGVLAGALVVSFVIVGAFYRVWSFEVAELRRRLKGESDRAAELAVVHRHNEQYQRLLRMLEMRVNAAQGLNDQRTSPVGFMADLGKVLTRSTDVGLSTITIEWQRWALHGHSRSPESPAKFAVSLERSGNFRDVQLRRVRQENQNPPTYKFDLDCIYSPPVPRGSTAQPGASGASPAKRADNY